MTITLQDKIFGRTIRLENVEILTTDVQCIGDMGYKIQFEDGTFNLFTYKCWTLIKVSK